MAYLYNAAGRRLYVQRRISDGAILKSGIPYPNLVDDAPLTGGDPNLEYLLIDQDPAPTEDPRIYTISVNRAKVGNLYRVTYTAMRKSVAAIKAAIQEKEAQELERHVKAVEREKIMVLAIYSLFTLLPEGTVLTQRQTLLKGKLAAWSQKIISNDQRAAELSAAADALQPIDLESGWTSE